MILKLLYNNKIDIKKSNHKQFDILIPKGLWGISFLSSESSLVWKSEVSVETEVFEDIRLASKKKRDHFNFSDFGRVGDFYAINLCKSGGKTFQALTYKSRLWHDCLYTNVCNHCLRLDMTKVLTMYCTYSPEKDLGFSLSSISPWTIRCVHLTVSKGYPV